MDRFLRPAASLLIFVSVGVIVIVNAMGATHAARPTPSSEATRAITAQQVGAGELLWQSARGLVPLPVIGLEVDLAVTGVMLRGQVTQTFRNPLTETIDVLYAFPLPARAAVHHMEIHIGDRRIVSVVQEKQQARRTYETAKAAGRKAALVDQNLGNLFTTKAANIGPGETIVVVLEYLEEVRWVDGGFELRFPLTYTPRFEPPASDRSPRGAQPHGGHPPVSRVRVPTATVRVDLDAGLTLAAVTSVSHPITADIRDSHARIATDPARVPADRDFLLRWTAVRKGEPDARVLTEDRDDGRYGLVMLMPPATDGAVGRGLPTETLFIVDVSGSMDGPSMHQARAALLAALDRLRPEDRFNLIRFNDTFTSFANAFVHAEGADLMAAKRWVRGLHAGGGTMILPALVGGMELLGQSRSSGAQRIVFLTDGAVSNEPEVLDAVVERLGNARLHTIGIGHAPNGWLMRKMAWHGRGLCTFISESGGARNGIDEFFGRLERPVLTDVVLSWDGTEPLDVLPTRIPDLYSGEPVYLSFRLAPGETPGALTVSGNSRVGPLERVAPLATKTADGSGLAVRWARARVAGLMDSLHEGADPTFVHDAVVDVALDFNLVTLYTSLVAVDHGQDDVDTAGHTRIAALLPRGGTDAPLRRWIGIALVALGLAMLPILWRPA